MRSPSSHELALAPGHALFIARRPYGFVNRGNEPRASCHRHAGVLRSDFFREVGAVVNAGGPPDLKRIGEIMQRHGLQAV